MELLVWVIFSTLGLKIFGVSFCQVMGDIRKYIFESISPTLT